LHKESLAILRRVDDSVDLIEALYDNGQLHFLLGDLAGARNLHTEAMERSQSLCLMRGVTINQLALGDLYFRQGESEAALNLYRQAANRARESGELSNSVNALLRLAALNRDAGRLSLAWEAAEEAMITGRKTGSPGLVAAGHYALGETNRLAGDADRAVTQFDTALELLVNAPDTELAWRVHYGRGNALEDQGRMAEAITALENAISLIEGVRNRLDRERFRAGYIQDKYQVYIDLVRLQIEIGEAETAFETAERLRSRSYSEMVEAHLPEAQDEDSSAEHALRRRIMALRQALLKEQNLVKPERRDAAIVVYSRELLAAEQAYQAMLDDRRKRNVPSFHPVPSYEEVRQLLGQHEALVEYVVGRDETVLFILTAEDLVTHTAALIRKDLDNKVSLVRSLIKRDGSDFWRKPAVSLAKSLLEPILAGGQFSTIDHIYLVPHGTLNYLPFAVLPMGNGKPVVSSFTLSYLPTAATLIDPRQSSNRNLGLLALAPDRSHLEFANTEAQAINDLFDPDSRLLLGPDATESAFKNEAGKYRVLHMATHGYFNKFNPMLSGLELEADHINDGQLELHEILGLQLNADLVTLSACQTGLGSGYFSTVPAGDDFVGLTRAFIFAGSSSVMATLWEVNDASTLELMMTFYGSLRQSGNAQDLPLSLARAQRAMLSSEEYSHPYYWAPFVLVGGASAKS
jgi:CHAT domain-containing protein